MDQALLGPRRRPTSAGRRKARLLAIPLLLTLLLSACGVGRGSAIAIGPNDTVKVGVIPAIAFAPVFVAIEQGYFEEAGISIETQVMQNAAAIAPSVLNGQLQFGTAAASPFIAARAKGLPLVATAGMSENSPESNDGAIVVRDGALTRPKDLEGRTVAINGVAALPHIALLESIRNDGGDPSTVTFVVMGFPEMAGALKQGRIDAAAITEPFTSAVTSDGGRILTRAYVDAFVDKATIGLIFTAEPFIETNPELVRAFSDAIKRAADDARSDPALVARVMTKHGGLPPQAFERMVLPPFTGELNIEGISQMSEVMTELDFVKKPLNGAEVVLP
ncbi:MAG: ABC transporter substrate-binding protein [Propionibacteriaceae bacterium]|nr:ABC transporter substrate-binding protein [Propionibacteriaceae bacterium]